MFANLPTTISLAFPTSPPRVVKESPSPLNPAAGFTVGFWPPRCVPDFIILHVEVALTPSSSRSSPLCFFPHKEERSRHRPQSSPKHTTPSPPSPTLSGEHLPSSSLASCSPLYPLSNACLPFPLHAPNTPSSLHPRHQPRACNAIATLISFLA